MVEVGLNEVEWHRSSNSLIVGRGGNGAGMWNTDRAGRDVDEECDL